MTRPSWPSTWMAMAKVIAQRSYDPRLKVGCVIVSTDNRREIAELKARIAVLEAMKP